MNSNKNGFRERLSGDSTVADRIYMPDVYRMLDSGKTVKETAHEYHVSRSFLYTLHLRYQKSIRKKSVTDILNSIYNMDHDDRTYSGRSTLANRKRAFIAIDMDEVYRRIDEGESVKNVAALLKMSEKTLRRRHKEYQEQLRGKEHEG